MPPSLHRKLIRKGGVKKRMPIPKTTFYGREETGLTEKKANRLKETIMKFLQTTDFAYTKEELVVYINLKIQDGTLGGLFFNPDWIADLLTQLEDEGLIIKKRFKNLDYYAPKTEEA